MGLPWERSHRGASDAQRAPELVVQIDTVGPWVTEVPDVRAWLEEWLATWSDVYKPPPGVVTAARTHITELIPKLLADTLVIRTEHVVLMMSKSAGRGWLLDLEPALIAYGEGACLPSIETWRAAHR